MGLFMQKDNDFEMVDNDIDTIDLTLEPSPEPEPDPRLPPRLLQMPGFIKREPPKTTPISAFIETEREQRPYNHIRVKNEPIAGPSRAYAPSMSISNQSSSSKMASWRGQRSEPVPVRANSSAQLAQPHKKMPEDELRNIANLLDATDPELLKKVLLELCDMSPALTGSLRRGLKHHSSRGEAPAVDSGKDTPAMAGSSLGLKSFSQHDGHAIQPPIKPEKNTSTNAPIAQERRLNHQTSFASSSEPQVRNSFSGPVPSSLVHRNENILPPASPSETTLHISGSLPRSSPNIYSGSTPQKYTADRFATRRVSRPIPVSAPASAAKFQAQPNWPPRRCFQCRNVPGLHDFTCNYHVGKQETASGNFVYSCCRRAVGEKGCWEGNHLYDPMNCANRRSASPSERSSGHRVKREY